MLLVGVVKAFALSGGPEAQRPTDLRGAPRLVYTRVIMESKRILLLTTPNSYRDAAFLAAAARLGVEAVRAVDMPPALASCGEHTLGLENQVHSLAPDKRAKRRQIQVDRASLTPRDHVVVIAFDR